jgi:hypothetical protein
LKFEQHHDRANPSNSTAQTVSQTDDPWLTQSTPRYILQTTVGIFIARDTIIISVALDILKWNMQWSTCICCPLDVHEGKNDQFH